MAKVAYTLRGAAKAASVSVRDIEVAVRDGKLTARQISGQPVLLKRDIRAWLRELPPWVTPRA